MRSTANERFGRPQGHVKSSLRPYAVDDPRARARLVGLAMLADGRISPEEVAWLKEPGGLQRIGVSRQLFLDVLAELCSDVSRLPLQRGRYQLDPAALRGLLAEIRDPQLRQQVGRLIFDVIRADHALAPEEQRLFWAALDAWGVKLDELRGGTHKSPLRTRRKSRHTSSFK